MSTVLREVPRRALKRHQCAACLTPIEPGTSYVRWEGVYDGYFVSAAYHPDCRKEDVLLNRDAAIYYSDNWMNLVDLFVCGAVKLRELPPTVQARFIPGAVWTEGSA